jgi:hypothetical protein
MSGLWRRVDHMLMGNRTFHMYLELPVNHNLKEKQNTIFLEIVDYLIDRNDETLY